MLRAVAIQLGGTEYDTILSWPYADQYVAKLLHVDIPRRIKFGDCQVWVYYNPDKQMVGFGVLDINDCYSDYTLSKPHPYIVLLAINPTIKSFGYGTSIVDHLIGAATVLAANPLRCCDRLFLDVYVDNDRGIDLYMRCGFVPVECEPIPDPLEAGKQYLVMSRSVAVEPTRAP